MKWGEGCEEGRVLVYSDTDDSGWEVVCVVGGIIEQIHPYPKGLVPLKT